MSIVDLNNLTDTGLVAQYVVELMGHGHFLSRDDHSRIERWLAIGLPVDDLLLILNDVLPERLEKARSRGKRVFSLASVGKVVERRAKDRRTLVGVLVNE
jgi:glutathione S-transferase